MGWLVLGRNAQPLVVGIEVSHAIRQRPRVTQGDIIAVIGGSSNAVSCSGKLRVEGKSYVINDSAPSLSLQQTSRVAATVPFGSSVRFAVCGRRFLRSLFPLALR